MHLVTIVAIQNRSGNWLLLLPELGETPNDQDLGDRVVDSKLRTDITEVSRASACSPFLRIILLDEYSTGFVGTVNCRWNHHTTSSAATIVVGIQSRRWRQILAVTRMRQFQCEPLPPERDLCPKRRIRSRCQVPRLTECLYPTLGETAFSKLRPNQSRAFRTSFRPRRRIESIMCQHAPCHEIEKMRRPLGRQGGRSRVVGVGE